MAMKKNPDVPCPVVHALNLLGGKWKVVVLSQLVGKGTLRFGELEQAIGGISPKMLTKVLRELEAEQLLTRQLFAAVPPRVEYAVTPLGSTLAQLIGEIHAWGRYHQQVLAEQPTEPA